METSRMTRTRLVLAIISTAAEEVAIYAIWRWALPEMDIVLPFTVLVVVMALWAVFGVTLFVFTTRTLRQQGVVGLPTMIGSRGKAASRMSPDGMVRIRGELWGARSDEGDLKKGEPVEVVGEEGLKLIVRRQTAGRIKR